MDILAHYDENLFKSLLDNPSISKIVAPVIFDPSAIDYANMITHIHSRVLSMASDGNEIFRTRYNQNTYHKTWSKTQELCILISYS